MRLLKVLRSITTTLDLRSTGKWFLFSALVGVVAGLGAIAFQFLTQVIFHFVLGELTGYYAPEPAGEYAWFHGTSEGFSFWLIAAVMAGGGLVSGVLVYTMAPEAEGHGTDAAIEAFHHKRGEIKARIPIVKMIASAVTIGTGGSAGREGPIAQIGAGFGSFLATRLKLTARDRRILLCVGMGAGVGAIFRAPLAGALFAGEILYREEDFESDVIVPAAIGSIIAYSVYCLSLPADLRFVPLFGGEFAFEPGSPLELLPLALLAVILSAAGFIYIKVFYGTHSLFKRIAVKPHFRPAIGALLAALLAGALYYGSGEDASVLAVLSTGYGALQGTLTSDIALGTLLLIAIGKVFTTSLTISSGGSGGVFGPSMVIGGCLGAAVGEVFSELWPTLVTQPKAYVIVGMAGFFAGCAHAPISTLIMVSELTGSYKLLLPAFWVCTLCFLFSRRWSIYEKQLPTRLESPAHRGDFFVDVLEGHKVRDVFQPHREVRTIPESTTLDDIVHLLTETSQTYFPVVDEKGLMVGIFSAKDVRAYMYDEGIWHVTIARDIMVHDVLTVTPDDDLNTALRRFTRRNIDELPVVEPEDPGNVLGMLRRKETIAFYNRRLMEQKRGVADP